MILSISIYVTFAILMLPVWSYLHERSHIEAFKKTTGLISYKIIMLPGWYMGKFYWARVKKELPRPPTKEEQAIISGAPYRMASSSVILLPIGPLLPDCMFWFWSIFWGAALVDIAVNACGNHENTDIQKLSRATGEDVLTIRLERFSMVALAVVLLLLVIDLTS